MIYNVKHRDNLIEEFGAYVAAFAEFQQEMNEMLHMEYDQEKYMIVKEDHVSLVDDVKRGRVDIGTAFKKMKMMAMKMQETLTKTYYGMSKDINDLLNQIRDIYEHNKLARFKHRNDIITKVEISSIIAIDKTYDKKYYGFAYAYTPLNAKYMIQQIDIIATALNSNDIEKVDNVYKDTKRSLDSFMAQYRNHELYKVDMEVKTYSNVKFGEATKVMLNQIDSYYNNIAGMNGVLRNQLLFIQDNETAYNTIKNRYSKNPKVMKYANELFINILEYMNNALTYDNLILETLTKIYKNTANQLIAMKEILES